MARTRAEVTEDLAAVRAAIKSAQIAQSYGSGLGNSRAMADLPVLYRREDQLLAERSAFDAKSGYAGMVRTVARPVR